MLMLLPSPVRIISSKTPNYILTRWCTGSNPDFATQDLFDAIENKTYPGWTLYAQVLTPQQAETFKCASFIAISYEPHSHLFYTFKV